MNNKKVGIITYHFTRNFDSTLQTFALYRVVSQMSELDVSILPYYKYRKVNYYYDNADPIYKKLIDAKVAKLRKFLIDECKLEDADTNDLSNYLDMDLYISGSDQIWNRCWPFSQCEEYLLSFVKQGKKIAYAPSIGIEEADMNDEYIDIFNKWLPQYDHLSIRERSHQELVQRIAGRECPVVLDPTLLLDVHEYDRVCNVREKQEPFILLIWINASTVMNGYTQALYASHAMGKKLVHNCYTLPTANNNCMYYEGVDEFLWCIKNADLVITDSYHATVFSIIYQKPFYSIITSARSRFETLLGDLGLLDRICNTVPIGAINTPIDWEAVDSRLADRRDMSMAYLRNALEI